MGLAPITDDRCLSQFSWRARRRQVNGFVVHTSQGPIGLDDQFHQAASRRKRDWLRSRTIGACPSFRLRWWPPEYVAAGPIDHQRVEGVLDIGQFTGHGLPQDLIVAQRLRLDALDDLTICSASPQSRQGGRMTVSRSYGRFGVLPEDRSDAVDDS